MTPEERAEKMWEYLLRPGSTLAFSNPRDYIADQIEEAVREAKVSEYAEARRLLDKYIDKAYLEGFVAARENAAEIAMDVNNPGIDDYRGEEIAKLIREMNP